MAKIRIDFTGPVEEPGLSMLAHAYAKELIRRGAKVAIFDSDMDEQTIVGNVIDCLNCSHLEVEIVKHFTRNGA